MKKLLLSLLALAALGFTQVSAQDVYWGAGFSLGRAYSPPKTFNRFGTVETRPSQPQLYYGGHVSIDAQVIPLADEMTIGFHAEPGLGYSIPVLNDFDDAILVLQSPLVAQFNYGNFSSGDATSSFGVGVGLGLLAQYQFDLGGLGSEPVAQGKSMLFLPTAQISLRFWSPNNKLYTVKLNHSVLNETFGGISNNRGTSFLSISRYINY